jgi:ABC-type lipoprotein export system ATPase subunit
MRDAVLELEEVTKVYGEEPPVYALRGASFSVRRGELVAIVGPSGSGKSTLLHVIGTLERPSSGVVRIGGVDAAGLDDRELSRLRVAIARALVGRPAIVLADEPTGNLDSTTGASIMQLIRELNAAGATILMITHDAGLADQLPRQIRMLDGQVVSDACG